MKRNAAARIVLLCALVLVAAPATAQGEYDANCKGITEETKLAEQETARLNPLFNLAAKMSNGVCRWHNALTSLLKKDDDPNKIDANDLVEVMKPKAPATSAPSDGELQKRMARRDWDLRHPNWREEIAALNRRQSNAANEYPIDEAAPAKLPYSVLPYGSGATAGFDVFQPTALKPDGTVAAPDVWNKVEGDGVLVTPRGAERGTFKAGQLEGDGERMTPEGAWQGGTFAGGNLKGDGFEVNYEGDQLEITEGRFENSKPEGNVRVTYRDGTSRVDLWQRGSRAMRGTLAAAGEVPMTPILKTPEMLAAEQRMVDDAAFAEQLAAAPNAAALYVMADEWREKGNPARARQALRTLMTRFPTSPLVERVIDQLSPTPVGATTTPRPYSNPPAASGGAPTAGGGGGAMSAGFRTQVSNPQLPASFYARYTAHGLTAEQCGQQATDLGWAAKIERINAGNDNILRLRSIITSMEGLIVITRQCENDTRAPGIMAGWAASRNSAIATCRATASDPAICFRSPF